LLCRILSGWIEELNVRWYFWRFSHVKLEIGLTLTWSPVNVICVDRKNPQVGPVAALMIVIEVDGPRRTS